jgi:precorrin-2 dehydrogenase / sirohydrochlorin ferrochelatase
MTTLSVNLIIGGKPCLVVGAGEVALRKIENLLLAGASVTVIAPTLHRQVQALGDEGRITLVQRKYQSGEVLNYFLVIAATGDRQVNGMISKEALEQGILCNVVDDAPLCSFIFPAVSRKGELQIAISSGGAIPFMVKRFRMLFDSLLSSKDWDEWWQQARILRDSLSGTPLTARIKDGIFDAFFSATITSGGSIEISKLEQAAFERLLQKAGDCLDNELLSGKNKDCSHNKTPQ